MKKIGLLILIVTLSIIIASIYGMLHNQISYAISTEYFTKFKFEQFGFWDYWFEDNNRKKVTFIGVLATWWFGLLIGLINGVFGWFQPTPKMMWKSSFGAILRILVITIGFGLVGILVGKFIISNLNVDWNIPMDLTDRKSFLTAGTMHDFGYIGGIIGLILGIRYQLKIKKANA